MHVACRSMGIGTKVHSPEDPVAQKERTREEERQKNVPGTAEASVRHRGYSIGHRRPSTASLVPSWSISAAHWRPRHTQQSEREDERAGEPHCEQHPLEQASQWVDALDEVASGSKTRLLSPRF